MLGYFKAKGLEGQCSFETGKPHVMVTVNRANGVSIYIKIRIRTLINDCFKKKNNGII